MNPLHEPDHHSLQDEQVSALCDGALNARELDELLERCHGNGDVQSRWQCYQLIGEVLRGQPLVLPACAPSAFLDRLHAGLKSESPALRAPTEPAPTFEVRGLAANDAVFRWKLVSGLASVVALAAIGWNLLAVAEPAVRGSAELAQSAPAAATTIPVANVAPAAIAPAAEPRAVVVSTPQGRVIRDAALERLLAEHRQHGGMSAFQTSTGFIRNATYDADAR